MGQSAAVTPACALAVLHIRGRHRALKLVAAGFILPVYIYIDPRDNAPALPLGSSQYFPCSPGFFSQTALWVHADHFLLSCANSLT